MCILTEQVEQASRIQMNKRLAPRAAKPAGRCKVAQGPADEKVDVLTLLVCSSPTAKVEPLGGSKVETK